MAAVSTLVARERGLARSCLLGAFWGAGHTLALLGAGIAVIAFKLTITPGLEEALEQMVGAGPRSAGRPRAPARRGGLLVHGREHTHATAIAHRHASLRLGPQEAGHVHLLRLGGRPFLVGLLHGLAGSAALTLLVLGAIPSPIGALLYILVFGIGSTAGMLLLSGLVGLPLALAAARGPPGRDGGPDPRRGRKRGPRDLDAGGPFRLDVVLPRVAGLPQAAGPHEPESIRAGRP